MGSKNKKFFSYYKPYLGLLFADIICAVFLSATTLALTLCTRFMTKNLSAEHISAPLLEQIYSIGAIMIGLLAIHIVCRMFVDYQGHVMGAKMERDIRRELFDHYQKLSFSFYDDQKTGQLITHISNDSYNLSELFHHGPEDIVVSLLNFLGALIILYHVNFQLSLAVFFLFPIMAIYAFYFNKKMNLASRKGRDIIGDINTQVKDTLSGIKVIKSFTHEAIEKEKFAYQNNRFLASRKDVYKNEAYFFSGMAGLTQIMSIGVVIFGSIKIIHHSLDMPDLLTFLLCISILIEPINRFSNFVRLYQEGITGFERLMEILAVKELDVQPYKKTIESEKIFGNIEFQKVSFKYKEKSEYVLKSISLTIKQGERIAFVGASGIGKTTLCSLIPRFYELNEGKILIDGKDIKDICPQSLRKNIGIVQQDIYLFAGSIVENIRYGKLDADMEQIVEAAKQANAHDFIARLPHGYHTNIGQGGSQLSGGQKQRISIARVFLKNPPILILDEATSALDSESEKIVQDSLEKLSYNRTSLLISHRLSTVKNADRIVVLTCNGISEQGTHDELIRLNGTYKSLYATH